MKLELRLIHIFIINARVCVCVCVARHGEHMAGETPGDEVTGVPALSLVEGEQQKSSVREHRPASGGLTQLGVAHTHTHTHC